MHKSQSQLIQINNDINSRIKELNFKDYQPRIIAVSKTFPMDKIKPLIEIGHQDFGENKVQEAFEKWSSIKTDNIKLHLIGKLQTNKVKLAVKLFDFIHSVDNEKLANKISEEQKKIDKNIKIFIQINLEGEIQKSGIEPKQAESFYNYCSQKLNLNVVGTMCLPPYGKDPEPYFNRLSEINKKLKLEDLSMGMSEDYMSALKYRATFLRIGSKIFGQRDYPK
tara:strand:- start:3203 stop:3871 length:669 start_codon:yes stop_codon:yes gene_type:complete